MTQLLLKLFVKDNENVTDPRVRSSYGRLSGLVGIVCNTLLFLSKLLVGTLSGSVSIVADAVNNLSDASSCVVTLVGFRLASKPADRDHPFGHARIEYLSGLAVAVMVLLIGVELVKTSVEKILHPQPVLFSFALVLVLCISIGVKLWMAVFNRTLGRIIQSAALEATAADSRNDVLSTSAVLLAAIVAKLTNLQIDGYVGLAVALFILYSGVGIAKSTIDPLLGEGSDPELVALMDKELMSDSMVLGYHDLMVHDYGPGNRFASVHVEMDYREDPLECHDVIDDIERRCMENHGVHLVIHYDPIVTDDDELNDARSMVLHALSTLDPAISIHDFRMVRSTGHINLIFDMVLPPQWTDRKSQIQQHLDAVLAREPHRYYTVITFDSTSFNSANP